MSNQELLNIGSSEYCPQTDFNRYIILLDLSILRDETNVTNLLLAFIEHRREGLYGRNEVFDPCLRNY